MSSFEDNQLLAEELPFNNLTHQQFNAIIGNWSREIDIDLYQLIPNPDKFDENDSEIMLNTPVSNYCTVDDMQKMLDQAGSKALSIIHCNIRSLSKNISLLSDLANTFSRKPDI